MDKIKRDVFLLEDEYKRHLYGGNSGLENIMPTGMDKKELKQREKEK